MARRTEAYADTSAFIALLDRSDTWHPLFRRLFADPPPLVSTPLVLAEGHGWFLRRYDRHRAREFLAFVELLEPLVVTPCGPEEVQAAAALVRRFPDQDLTLADAMGLFVMDERRVRSCWSTDHHLGLTGVPLVIHDG
jgi:predicted nucleic acid-binding protein